MHSFQTTISALNFFLFKNRVDRRLFEHSNNCIAEPFCMEVRVGCLFINVIRIFYLQLTGRSTNDAGVKLVNI